MHHLIGYHQRQLHLVHKCRVHALGNAGKRDRLAFKHHTVVHHCAQLALFIRHLHCGLCTKIGQRLHQIEHIQIAQSFFNHFALHTIRQIGLSHIGLRTGQELALIVQLARKQAVEFRQHLGRERVQLIGSSKRQGNAGFLQVVGVDFRELFHTLIRHGNMRRARDLVAHGRKRLVGRQAVAHRNLMLRQRFHLRFGRTFRQQRHGFFRELFFQLVVQTFFSGNGFRQQLFSISACLFLFRRCLFRFRQLFRHQRRHIVFAQHLGSIAGSRFLFRLWFSQLLSLFFCLCQLLGLAFKLCNHRHRFVIRSVCINQHFTQLFNTGQHLS